MNRLLKLLLFVIGLTVARADPFTLDFSHSHTEEDVLKSNLPVKEIRGRVNGRDFVFEAKEVTLCFPGDRKMSQEVVLGSISSKDGALRELMIYGDPMPNEQGFLIAQQFHRSFGIPAEGLNDWYQRNKEKGRDVETYSASTNPDYYPQIGFEIGPSMNRLYPIAVKLVVVWNAKMHRDWNEERTWKEAKAPDAPSAVISLNPPSGLKYSRADAHKALQEEDEKLRQQTKDSGKAVAAIQAQPSVSENSMRRTWLIAAVVFVIVLAGLCLRLVRK